MKLELNPGEWLVISARKIADSPQPYQLSDELADISGILEAEDDLPLKLKTSIIEFPLNAWPDLLSNPVVTNFLNRLIKVIDVNK